jgi:hypothetical protein
MRRAIYKTKVMHKAIGASASTEAAASTHMAVLQVMRFDPATNTKRIDNYQYEKKQDFMVLDLLTAIKAHQDPSLAFRASCCEGVCGSCAMNINGVNSLACVTYAAQGLTTVGPLPNFPVLKDMVVDVKGFFKQYEYIRPFVRNHNLQSYHIDSIYSKYVDACATLYGTPAAAATAATEGEGAAYAKLLAKVVSVGDVPKAVHVINVMTQKGFAPVNGDAAAAIATAQKNFEAK